MNIVIVIVEDEPLVQQRIKRLSLDILAEQQPKIVCFENLDDADAYLAENSIDLLLLDLNLMGKSGFELLKRNVAAAYHTIIISAYADKAIEAFEYGVIDFVAKPFSSTRLEKAFSRFIESSERSYYGCRHLSIKKMGAIELIKIADISYIRAEGHYSEVHFNNEPNKTALHAKNIEKILQLLPDHFVRVHRSFIANMRLIEKINVEEGSRYSMQLINGKSIPIGRTRYNEVKNYLDK